MDAFNLFGFLKHKLEFTHATASLASMYDRVKQAMILATDRAHVPREMAYVCRPAGTLPDQHSRIEILTQWPPAGASLVARRSPFIRNPLLS